MPINFGLLDTSNGFLDAWNKGVLTRQAMDSARLKQQQAQETYERQKRGLDEIHGLVGQGRINDAGATAAAYGLDDTAERLNTNSKNRYDQGGAVNGAIAHYAHSIRSTVPMGSGPDALDRRRIAIDALRPQLRAMGASEEQINAVRDDPNDEILYALEGYDYSVKDANADAVARQTADTNRQNADTQRFQALHPTVDGAYLSVDPETDQSSVLYRAPKYQAVDPANNYYETTPGVEGDGQSYRDPVYDRLEGQLEQKYGLPEGIMGAIRTRGERSNADQVSEAGARSVYQIIPDTRAAFARKYGVDAYSSPEAAAEVAALHLKESFERGGDWNQAVREYHGGTNPANWGPRTRAYVERAGSPMGGSSSLAGEGGSATGGPRLMQPGKPKQFRNMTGEEVAARGYAPGTVAQIGPDGKEVVQQNPARSRAGVTQTNLARTKLKVLDAIMNQLARAETAMIAAEKKGHTGWIGGHLPGKIDADDDKFDTAIAGLSPLIRQLTRVPGEGAMSDYETRLAQAALPSRTQTSEGRREALAQMRDLVEFSRSGYSEVLAGDPSSKQAAPQPKPQNLPTGWSIKRVR